MSSPIDPWRQINPPADLALINARRVDPSARWDLFWGVDNRRNPLLVLQHGKGLMASRRLPKLRGLRVETLPGDRDNHERIVIRLIDQEQREIFLQFCRDIVDATMLANNEEQAVQHFLTRTWRWHRLLQLGRDRRLSDQEQRGLIGELVVLVRHMLPALGATAAVRSWTGPLESPHDFELSQVHVEAKARSSSLPVVRISSEFQLDSSNANTLFLHVTEVTTATKKADNASTLSDFANMVRGRISGADITAVDLLEQRLAAAGFDWSDNYTDKPWTVGDASVYEIGEGFPRITPTMCPAGVSNVGYAIRLADCKRFLVDSSTLRTTISEVADDG